MRPQHSWLVDSAGSGGREGLLHTRLLYAPQAGYLSPVWQQKGQPKQAKKLANARGEGYVSSRYLLVQPHRPVCIWWGSSVAHLPLGCFKVWIASKPSASCQVMIISVAVSLGGLWQSPVRDATVPNIGVHDNGRSCPGKGAEARGHLFEARGPHARRVRLLKWLPRRHPSDKGPESDHCRRLLHLSRHRTPLHFSE